MGAGDVTSLLDFRIAANIKVPYLLSLVQVATKILDSDGFYRLTSYPAVCQADIPPGRQPAS